MVCIMGTAGATTGVAATGTEKTGTAIVDVTGAKMMGAAIVDVSGAAIVDVTGAATAGRVASLLTEPSIGAVPTNDIVPERCKPNARSECT
jgi:hypothetical protein